MQKKNFQFKTEVNEILNLVINSLYSNKEIFFRELVSNSSDAIEKLRFNSQIDESLKNLDLSNLQIKISFDKDKKTLKIEDNGIGMNEEDLIANIGTIAKSGTKEFIEKVKESKGNFGEMIGQFGVGFYSSFIVAEKVEVLTKKAGQTESFKWTSDGKGSFEIEKAEKESFGTEIVLHLKDDCLEFLDEWKIKEIIKKHSDFIEYKILLLSEGKEEILNSMKAIWERPKSQIKEEEYEDFFKHTFHEFEKPLITLHSQAEGGLEYKSLIFVPGKFNQNLLYQDRDFGLNLYVKKVLITKDFKELLPTYLRFLKGVVSCPDLPLNVSREILQSNAIITKINKNITKKFLSNLKEPKENDRKKYEIFYKEFGKILKEGIYMDFENIEILKDLLLFETNNTKKGEYIDLKEYISGMKESQKEIYFILGNSREEVEKSSSLEIFEKEGIEVIFMTDSIDEWICDRLDGEDKKFQSITKGDFDFGKINLNEEEYKEILEEMKKLLGESVQDIKLSKRLTKSPAILIDSPNSVSESMKKMFEQMGHKMPEEKKILEINGENELVKKIKGIFALNKSDERIAVLTKILYIEALLKSGEKVEDLDFFISKVNEIIAK